MRGLTTAVMGTAIVLGATASSAQDISTAQVAPATTTATGASVTDTSGPTDHSVVVGHLGLRYFGAVTVPLLPTAGQGVPSFGSGQSIVNTTDPGAENPPSATLQTIGVRYWLNSSLALEGGLALGIGTGSVSRTMPAATQNATNSADTPNYFGIGLHAGMPITLAESKHVAIHLVPYVGFYYAQSAIQVSPDTMSTNDQTSSTALFHLGANAQAELQFGFLGIPQLGLLAQFGLGMRYFSQANRSIVNPGNRETSTTGSGFGISTTVGPNYSLAEILSGSISAVWYFGSSPGR